jgi:hypothetical protein
MNKENTSIMGYVGYGALFIFELTAIPYYEFENAYYRAQNRLKKFYTPLKI